MNRCPNCGNMEPEGAVFCTACGTKMDSTGLSNAETIGEKKMYCPNCGNEVTANDRFCYICGYALRGSSLQENTQQRNGSASGSSSIRRNSASVHSAGYTEASRTGETVSHKGNRTLVIAAFAVVFVLVVAISVLVTMRVLNTRDENQISSGVEDITGSAVLTVIVEADQAYTVEITETGTDADGNGVFEAETIEAAVEQLLPEGYSLEGAVFQEVTVPDGETSQVTFETVEALAYADAMLNITLVADESYSTQLTDNGVTEENATFSAEEISSAVYALIPDGYELISSTFDSATVAYGASMMLMFYASEAEDENSAVSKTYDGVTITTDYIFSDSDSRYLTRSDLVGLSRQELKIARNEIYARHGMIFETDELQAYFESCDWYSGTIAKDAFDTSVFNEYELENAALILSYEKEKGYY